MNKNGFTIIELIVVIGIIGILTTILFPSYKNYVERKNEVTKTYQQKLVPSSSIGQNIHRKSSYPYKYAIVCNNGGRESNTTYRTNGPIDHNGNLRTYSFTDHRSNIKLIVPINQCRIEEYN